jgi:transcriptional regulator with XRE-family HTH domain
VPRLFRNNLKMLRAALPISQLDLAIRIPMSSSRYWRIENGYEVPNDVQQRQIARALGVEIRALGFNPMTLPNRSPAKDPRTPDDAVFLPGGDTAPTDPAPVEIAPENYTAPDLVPADVPPAETPTDSIEKAE